MLTDILIKRVTFPTGRPKKLHDSHGLYLLCRPNGGRWWRLAYRFAGVPKTLSMGTYGTVTLSKAREKAREARALLDAGQDPSAARRAATRRLRAGTPFATVAREWLQQQGHCAPKTRHKQRWLVDKMIVPALGRVEIGSVSARDVAVMALGVQDRISSETAHRAKQAVGQILRYAVATGRATRDVTVDLRGALQPVVVTHRSALIEPKQIGGLMRAIDSLEDSPIVRAALQLLALTFVRPGELRTAAWADIDIAAMTWRVPAARMKMRQAHVVPLATQALTVLRTLHTLTGAGTWLFPAIRTPRRPMSDGTINAALRRIGYTKEQMTGHGFRAMARTVLAEGLLEDPYVIEAQLAHATPGPLGATYARTQYLAQRRAMMQRWADHLDLLKAPPAEVAARA